jgi:hypothetical protein
VHSSIKKIYIKQLTSAQESAQGIHVWSRRLLTDVGHRQDSEIWDAMQNIFDGSDLPKVGMCTFGSMDL